MTPALYLPIAAASLLGSLHCAGMCGGFVLVYSAGDRSSGVARALPHAAYHVGRLVTYVALGAAAGALGAALDLAGHAAGLGRVAAVVAGVIMVVWALATLLGGRLGSTGAGVRGRVVRILAGFRDKPPIVRAGLLGLSSTLLPCGWLYAFAVAAAGTGSALSGALVMAAFWSGTVPMLLGLGVSLQALAPRLRRHVPLLSAVVVLAIGLSAVIGRWNVPAMAAQTTNAALSETPSKPCCHSH